MTDAKELMTTAVEVGASDLHLNPGRPPVARIDGKLVSLGTQVLDDAACETLCRQICDEKHWAEVERIGTLRNKVVASKAPWGNFAAGQPTGPLVKEKR